MNSDTFPYIISAFKFVVNLGAPGMVHAKDQIKSLAARRLGLDSADANFPEIVQSDFDGAVSGKTFLDDVCESNQGVHQVVDQPGIYLKPDATTL